MNRKIVIALLAATFAFPACEEDPQSPGVPAPDAGSFAFVTTTDFQTGSSSVVDLEDNFATTENVASIHSDAVARFADGLVYVVNRFGADNIQILDPATGFGAVRQFSTGNGSDPHDIAVVSKTKAYVTRYNESMLWIVDPSTGANTGAIDLSAFADGDGIPEMDHLMLSGDSLYIAVQRIDRNTDWNPVGQSYVAVVDVSADTLIDTAPATIGTQPIVLSAANPFSDLQIDKATGRLYVACVGDWGVADAGVQAVDPHGMATGPVVLPGATVGGDITDVEIVSATVGYVIITDASFNNTLLQFDPSDASVTMTVYAPGSFVLQDIARPTDGGPLFLADRTATNPGIRLYDALSGSEITTKPIDVGLPPFQITFGSLR